VARIKATKRCTGSGSNAALAGAAADQWCHYGPAGAWTRHEARRNRGVHCCYGVVDGVPAVWRHDLVDRDVDGGNVAARVAVGGIVVRFEVADVDGASVGDCCRAGDSGILCRRGRSGCILATVYHDDGGACREE